MTTAAAELVDRSNRLGADPRNTNYAGGNTSAKGTETDPVTGEDVELLWVKGSGGDLGTLTEAGLAVLRLDRMRALVDVYPGVDREDEMVAAFDYCLHGKGGAAPSIDTAMHGLVDAPHVDHLHPDSGIAIATAADGEALTRKIFGDKVVWVPWRRPGLPARPRHRRDQGGEPAGDRLHPRRARHHRLGRHLARSASGTRCGSSAPPSATSRSTPKKLPFGARLQEVRAAGPGRSGGPGPPSSRRCCGASRRRTGRWSATSPTTRWCWTSWPRGTTRGWPSSGPAARTTSCAPRSSRWCSTCRRARRWTKVQARVAELHAAYRADYQAYYDRNATAGLAGDPRRGPADHPGARRRDVLLRQGQADRPGGRRVLRQRDQRDARRRGALDVRPDRRVGEVPDRVLGAGGGQAPADAAAEAARHPDRAGHRRRLGHRQGDRGAARRRGRLRRDRRPVAGQGAGRRPRDRRQRRRGRRAGRRLRRGRRAGHGRRGGARLRRGRPGRQQRRPLAVQAAARDHRRRTGTCSTT